MSYAAVSPDKNYLTQSNQSPLFVRGANYEGYFDRAWHLWDADEFDEPLIARDFSKMADSGLNVVRLFVQSALAADIRADNFSKLDRVLQLAADHQLAVILTFNDAHSLNLSQVAQLDAKIATRYRDDPLILAWDLENEPVFYNFAAAIYPTDHPAPIHSNELVDQYGARVSQQEAQSLQQQHHIPAHLNPMQAFWYINGLRLFIEFHNDGTAWALAHGKTLVDYIYSSESAAWHKLLDVLNRTVAAWLAVRHNAVRAADPNHLITVGYHWLHFAALPANRKLGFQTIHQYSDPTFPKFKTLTQTLLSLKNVFPNHPMLMGEFGYSNQTGTNPANSQPVDEQKTALFEVSLLAFLRANKFAGGIKWMLNDVDTDANPREANFGIYRMGDHPKPIQALLKLTQRTWASPPQSGTFNVVQDPLGAAFRLSIANRIMLAGGTFQDDTVSWRADGAGYCFLQPEAEGLTAFSHGDGSLTVDIAAVVPNWDATRPAVLTRETGNLHTQMALFPPADPVEWHVVSGEKYHVAMGEPLPEPPTETPIIEPNPGEHVVLLGDADAMLRRALPYIRHFATDVTFAAGEVAGRWLYVSVIASAQQVPEAVLQEISAAGAHIVDRISENIDTTLATLVTQNRRFLAEISPPPPVEPPVEPPPPAERLYTIQPGDSLYKIALHFYGNGGLWRIIFDTNRDIIDSPSHIRPGMQLKIPPKP